MTQTKNHCQIHSTPCEVKQVGKRSYINSSSLVAQYNYTNKTSKLWPFGREQPNVSTTSRTRSKLSRGWRVFNTGTREINKIIYTSLGGTKFLFKSSTGTLISQLIFHDSENRRSFQKKCFTVDFSTFWINDNKSSATQTTSTHTHTHTDRKPRLNNTTYLCQEIGSPILYCTLKYWYCIIVFTRSATVKWKISNLSSAEQWRASYIRY